ncbi:hypothetical protein HWV62_11822 [Athelia sp. TMB]|nr:hypothetical protein HWV62_11822 [Athelia sp. TMB]
MSHRPTMPIASTCAVLSCTLKEFWAVYENTTLSASALSEDALAERRALLSAEPRYRLDELLAGMLEHAPHPASARYAAAALRLASAQGGAAVVRVAQAWMEQLFLPLLARSKAAAPAFEPEFELSGSPTPAEAEDVLRDTVTRREAYHCAIMQTFDQARARSLRQQGLRADIPRGVAQRVMEVAYILPVLHTDPAAPGDAARIDTDMLQCWTHIDIHALAEPTNAANAIYMTSDDRTAFGRLEFYLNADAVLPRRPEQVPDAKRARGPRPERRERGSRCGIPDVGAVGRRAARPRAHAAFARVLERCGAAQYVECAEVAAEDEALRAERAGLGLRRASRFVVS